MESCDHFEKDIGFTGRPIGKDSSKIGAIIAITERGVLGCNNDLPWKKGQIKSDLAHFKRVTEGNVIIEGCSTFKSLGSESLPNRVNIVVSRTLSDDFPGVAVHPSLGSALGAAVMHGKQIWFIGGANLLSQVMEMRLLDRIWITRVLKDYDGDVILDWNEQFLTDNGYVRTYVETISDGDANLEYWGRVE